MNPCPGQIVMYRSKIDHGPGNDVISPAIALRTRATTVDTVLERWSAEPRTVASATDPDVTHDTTVDLLVHGLGRDYREYAVPMGDTHGTWHWPEHTL